MFKNYQQNHCYDKTNDALTVLRIRWKSQIDWIIVGCKTYFLNILSNSIINQWRNWIIIQIIKMFNAFSPIIHISITNRFNFVNFFVIIYFRDTRELSVPYGFRNRFDAKTSFFVRIHTFWSFEEKCIWLLRKI